MSLYHLLKINQVFHLIIALSYFEHTVSKFIFCPKIHPVKIWIAVLKKRSKLLNFNRLGWVEFFRFNENLLLDKIGLLQQQCVRTNRMAIFCGCGTGGCWLSLFVYVMLLDWLGWGGHVKVPTWFNYFTVVVFLKPCHWSMNWVSHFFFSYRSQVTNDAATALPDSGTIEELRFVIKKQEVEIQNLQEKWQNLVIISTDFSP